MVHADTEINRSHIVSCCLTPEKIDVEDVIKIIKERAFLQKSHEKLKMIFTSRLGVQYWRKDPNFSLNDHIEVVDRKFSNLDELNDFLHMHAAEVNFPQKQPEWRFFILPNCPENQSGFVMKIHHSLGDGLSLMNYAFNLGDTKEYKLIEMKKFSRCQKLLIYIIGIWEALKFAKVVFGRKKDSNNFMKKPMTGKKSSYGSCGFDMRSIKNFAKTNGYSVNDVFLALLSKTFQRYHQRVYNEELKQCSIMIAASTRPMPLKGEVYPLENKISFLPQDLYFDENLEKCINRYNKNIKSSKLSYGIYIQQLAAKIFYHLSLRSLNEFFMKYITGTYSAIFTSVPGPITPITLFGYEIKDIFFVVSGIGMMRIICNILTYNGRVSMAILADESTGINCKEFVEEFAKVFEENVKFKFEKKNLE